MQLGSQAVSSDRWGGLRVTVKRFWGQTAKHIVIRYDKHGYNDTSTVYFDKLQQLCKFGEDVLWQTTDERARRPPTQALTVARR